VPLPFSAPLDEAPPVVFADGWRVIGVQSVKDTDSVGLVGQVADVVFGGPAVGGPGSIQPASIWLRITTGRMM